MTVLLIRFFWWEACVLNLEGQSESEAILFLSGISRWTWGLWQTVDARFRTGLSHSPITLVVSYCQKLKSLLVVFHNFYNFLILWKLAKILSDLCSLRTCNDFISTQYSVLNLILIEILHWFCFPDLNFLVEKPKKSKQSNLGSASALLSNVEADPLPSQFFIHKMEGGYAEVMPSKTHWSPRI